MYKVKNARAELFFRSNLVPMAFPLPGGGAPHPQVRKRPCERGWSGLLDILLCHILVSVADAFSSQICFFFLFFFFQHDSSQDMQ